MIKSKYLKSILVGMTCFAGAATLSAQINYDRASFWNQEHIKKVFLNSYQVNTDIEPKLTEEEKALIRELMPQLELNPTAVKDGLLNSVNTETSAAVYFLIGNFYAEDGEIATALEYYETAIEKFPNFRRAIKNVSFMKVRDGAFDDALKSLTKVINLGANDTTVFGLLGLCYVNTGNYISAETAYRQAIVLDPSVNDWRVGLAKSLLSQEKYKESIKVLDEILNLDPENDIIWSSQANAYLGIEDLDNAVANQEIVDRLGKSTAESLVFMGRIYMSQGLNDLALEKFKKALTKDSNQPADVQIDIAGTLVSRGAFDESQDLINSIRGKYTDITKDQNILLLRLESQIALSSGNPDKAIPILEKLLASDPLDGQALILLAEHHTSLDTSDGYSRADLYYERAIKVDDQEIRALISWARSYVARERFDKAIPLLERANTKQPRDYITRYLEQVRMVNRTKAGI